MSPESSEKDLRQDVEVGFEGLERLSRCEHKLAATAYCTCDSQTPSCPKGMRHDAQRGLLQFPFNMTT